ncbi:RING-type E3 ubiquitin transferase [Ranunculus cassubicifolius]
MARKKQFQPRRSGSSSSSAILENLAQKSHNTNLKVDENNNNDDDEDHNTDLDITLLETNRFIDIDDDSSRDLHRDIAEVIVTDHTNCSSSRFVLSNPSNSRSNLLSLRFRLRNVDWKNDRVRLVNHHWPVMDINNVFFEVLDNEKNVVFSGNFDGTDESVSSLVHLVSQKMLTVRLVKEIEVSSSVRVRVEILENAFDACESVLDCGSRQPWKKSMISVMKWLRPEVMTKEMVYGSIDKLDCDEKDTKGDNNDNDSDVGVRRRDMKFDPAEFYEAIKPSKDAPMLEDEITNLLPELRPYQRRAAYWMVQREKGIFQSLGGTDQNEFLRPLCVPVNFLQTDSRMFYNPFSGSVSMHPESIESHVSGGILADEMGLGKTVELLACVFAHRKSISEGSSISDVLKRALEDQVNDLKRLKIERVECICGAVSESPKYKGLWVQCDACDAWQHADCVGYSPKGNMSSCKDASKERSHRKGQSPKSCKKLGKRNTNTIVEMDGHYICQLCSELIQASHAPVDTGATLIVCPSTILQQWHSEILRHTEPGSLKICIYEGVRNASLSASSSMDISELLNADIVLTTYEVLKEDLSHDSDRNEGDRRLMRFEKRYPVIPTLLTRIFWWRVCLDEAQMVECNTANATEMALRLHAKYHWCITGTPIQRRLDDLYGLLKFLRASPFDVRRWWLEVIKDPYERRDPGSMEFAHKFFKQIMWRSMKVHVADELELPPQDECVCWLFLSPIEAHFYQKQHETCSSYAHELIKSLREDAHKKNSQGSQWNDALCDTTLTQAEAAKLLNSLLKLRQACCHPQVGSSGLRSLQHSLRSLHHAPMTMEEVLGVLVGKAKLEGEEALRISVMSLNALAGIAVIKGEIPEAVSLYRESLTLAEEHCDDFQLDPLVNLHIHYNLAEIFADTAGILNEVQLLECQFPENIEERALRLTRFHESHDRPAKRQKTSKENSSCSFNKEGNSQHPKKEFTSDEGHEDMQCDSHPLIPLKSRLRMAYENLKQKFLGQHASKLYQAQQEFRDSYSQVCKALLERNNDGMHWWLEALHHIEKNKESTKQFLSKVEDALGALHTSKQTNVASRFESINGMKYVIQTGLDLLESSRLELIERILEIDMTMEQPRDADILSGRSCRNCLNKRDGPICVRCDLDNLLRVYMARLFFCKTEVKVGETVAVTAEEAVQLNMKSSGRNQFFKDLENLTYDASLQFGRGERNKIKSDLGSVVMFQKAPSEIEIVLGVLRTFSKSVLGRDGFAAATKHLFVFEAMRKEYAPAVSLANIQTTILEVHGELMQGISRLRLREADNDTSMDSVSIEELDEVSMRNTSNKFASVSSLSRLKGQLRYLKGLVLSNQKSNSEGSNTPEDADKISTDCIKELDQCRDKSCDEACPVCQENLTAQKMVYQCGHIICCKCLVAMIERRISPQKSPLDIWVMCPTCRQHTSFRNIACVDDRQNKPLESGVRNIFQLGHEKPEASITVKGSYGTKIEAITRRILSIKRTDPMAKILVFSSWNDVLDVLEHALSGNDISHIRMKGGRKSHMAIKQFKGHGDDMNENGNKHDQQPRKNFFQVMLLLIQHGANGLNLLEAKHVILVEPLLNPAAEAQAINRVHRIGQDKLTMVHRFIVKDTVEESIYKLNRSRNTNTIIRNTKNQDHQDLTLKDVESLFASTTPAVPPEQEENDRVENLMHLPPTVAAALAAQRRLEGLAQND